VLRSENQASHFDENWYAWIERAYLHALRRGAFVLAAEIAQKHDDDISEFNKWGVNLAFESACKSDLEEAGYIARRWLDRQAQHRVIILTYQKKREEERRKLLKRSRRACADADDWCIKRIP
jgi:hypothetical protein